MGKTSSKGLRIIYDGQCAFCIRLVYVVKKLDSFAALDFYDSHDEGIMEEKFPMVKPEDAEEAMLAVTKEGRVFKGFYAFRRLVWRVPWLWALAAFLYLPGSSYFGTRLYAWVARNRQNFGCGSQRGETSIHLAPTDSSKSTLNKSGYTKN